MSNQVVKNEVPEKKMNVKLLGILLLSVWLLSFLLVVIDALSSGFGYAWYMGFAGAGLGMGIILFTYAIIYKNALFNAIGTILVAACVSFFLLRYVNFAGNGWLIAIIALLIIVVGIICRVTFSMKTNYEGDNESPEYKHYEERRAEQQAKEVEQKEQNPEKDIVFKKYDDNK